MNLSNEEKIYFEKLEQESKNNPMIRMQAAAQFSESFLRRALNQENSIPADWLCYIMSVMAGISVGVAAKKTDNLMLIEGELNNVNHMPMMKIDTDAGVFWMGDTINRYIFNHPLSVWNIVMSVYSGKYTDSMMPELNNMIAENTKKIGNKDARVWNNQHNPYEELASARNTYNNIHTKLEPYKLKDEEYPSVFGLALSSIIVKVKDVFPAEINCLEMSMDTMLFYAHMDM